jgi:hypothetical protein
MPPDASYDALSDLLDEAKEIAHLKLGMEADRILHCAIQLPEATFFAEDRFVEAGLLHALGYDLTWPHVDPVDERTAEEELRRVFLLFKVAYCMEMAKEPSERCVGFYNRAVDSLRRLWERSELCVSSRLMHLSAMFLPFAGYANRDTGNFKMAKSLFEWAHVLAEEPAEKFRLAFKIAEAIGAIEGPQNELAALMSIERQVGDASADVASLFRQKLQMLRIDLGYRDVVKLSEADGPLEFISQVLSGEAELNAYMAEQTLKMLLGGSGPGNEDADPEDQLSSAIMSMTVLDPIEQNAEWLAQVEIGENAAHVLRTPKLNRRFKLLRARGMARLDPKYGVELLTDVVKQLREFDPDNALADALAWQMIATPQAGLSSAALMDIGTQLLTEIKIHWSAQPTKFALRRWRQMHQSLFDCGVLSIVGHLESKKHKKEEKHRLLCMLWEFAAMARNPDQLDRHDTTSISKELTILEEKFHAAVARQRLTVPYEVEMRWRKPLQKLLDKELVEAGKRETSEFPSLDTKHETSVLQYAALEAATEPALITLIRSGDHLDHYVQAYRPALSAAKSLAEDARAGRPVSAVCASEALAGWFALTNTQKVPAANFYVEPEWTSLPLETIIAPRCDQAAYGVTPLRKCEQHMSVRPNKLDALFIGGISGCPRAPYLPASDVEIRDCSSILEQHGKSSLVMTGPLTTPTHVMNLVAEHRPKILHMACHGLASDEYEANALVLEEDEGRPHGRLLSSRQIEALPMDGTNLVVLSACDSAYASGHRGISTQGLAWAFLNAGVRNVLATRYSVLDREAAIFMSMLYGSLAKLAVQEALFSTRKEAFGRIAERERNAWILFSN